MSSFSEEEMISSVGTPIINAVDVKKEGNDLIITDETGKVITLTLTDEALRSLPEVLPPSSEGGARRRKSRKHKAVKRRKTHRRRRHH